MWGEIPRYNAIEDRITPDVIGDVISITYFNREGSFLLFFISNLWHVILILAVALLIHECDVACGFHTSC